MLAEWGFDVGKFQPTMLCELISMLRTRFDDSGVLWDFVMEVIDLAALDLKCLNFDTQGKVIVEQLVRHTSSESPASHAHNVRIFRLLVEKGVDISKVAGSVLQYYGTESKYFCQHRWLDHFACLREAGQDIQGIMLCHEAAKPNRKHTPEECDQADQRLTELKQTQLRSWKIADSISDGRPLLEVQRAVAAEQGVDGDGAGVGVGAAVTARTARDRHGHSLLHVAALHDRADVIHWLHDHCGVHVTGGNTKSKHSGAAHGSSEQSTLALSQSSGCLRAATAIQQILAGDKLRRFVYRAVLRRRVDRVLQAKIISATSLQSAFRRYCVFRTYSPLLRAARDSRSKYLATWGTTLAAYKNTARSGQFSWAAVKYNFDLAVDFGNDDDGDSSSSCVVVDGGAATVRELITQAAANITVDEAHANSTSLNASAAALEKQDSDFKVKDPVNSSSFSVVVADVDAVELAQAVVRWLDKADAAYRVMFLKKICSLAQGERSYALCKRLQGTEYPVFESKLDAGQRILWTKVLRGDKQHILVSSRHPYFYLHILVSFLHLIILVITMNF